jgi:type IV secretory pathway VirJ component
MTPTELWAFVLPAMLAGAGPGPLASRPDAADLLGLPLIELPATPGHALLAVLLTGDGGWAKGDESMAVAFRARAIPVIGFVSPSYLQVPRTPDGAGADFRRVLDHYLREWHLQRVIVVGYSRGADLLPFMVSRLPPDLRRRLALVAMIGLSDQASFQYRPTDILADGLRFTDRPVEPEVKKLRGLRLMCLSGERESGSLCPRLDPSLIRIASHSGGHRVTQRVGASVVDLMMAEVQRDGETTRRSAGPRGTPDPHSPRPPPQSLPT